MSLGVAEFTIVWDQDSSTAVLADMPDAPIDPYLYIKNTDYEVHLIDQAPLPGSCLDESEDYRDGDGFPRALLVPSIIDPPAETVSILDAYPEFQGWIDYLGHESSDCYFSPVDDLVLGIDAD